MKKKTDDVFPLRLERGSSSYGRIHSLYLVRSEPSAREAREAAAPNALKGNKLARQGVTSLPCCPRVKDDQNGE